MGCWVFQHPIGVGKHHKNQKNSGNNKMQKHEERPCGLIWAVNRQQKVD